MGIVISGLRNSKFANIVVRTPFITVISKASRNSLQASLSMTLVTLSLSGL